MASSESSSLPENVPSMDQTKAMIIDELEHGRELATQLRDMLSGGGGGESSGSEAEIAATGDLVARIMTSFSNSLSWLDQNDTVVKAENSNYEVMSSDLDGGRKSEDSEESNCRSSSSSPPARSPKDRRGSYKRRRTSHSWMKETPTETNDGHAWRKYGQKRILKAKYPRNYFRCTHKYDQQCQATKDVQRIQEEPPMFRTTYYGRHTCRALSTAPELVLDCLGPTHTSAVLLSFNTTANNNNNYIHDLNNLAAKHSLHSPPFNSLNAATTITNTPHLVKQEYINNNNGEILLGVDDQIITSPYNCHNNINNMIDNMAHQDQQYQGDVNSGEVINNYNMDTPFDDFHQYFNDLI